MKASTNKQLMMMMMMMVMMMMMIAHFYIDDKNEAESAGRNLPLNGNHNKKPSPFAVYR